MSAEQTPDIAAVLAEHDGWSAGGGTLECACGEMIRALGASVSLVDCEEIHRAHVAAALAPVLAASEERAWDRGFIARLGDTPRYKTRDEWGNPYRADRITEPVSHEAATSGKEESKA